MTTITIYKYQHKNGIVSIGPNKPQDDDNVEVYYRLVADEGKILTNGILQTKCVPDAINIEEWYEIVDQSAEEKPFKFPTLDDYR